MNKIPRNLDNEFADNQGRKYAYGFDDLMKVFMMRTFKKYAPKGRALELGAYKGEFTEILVNEFEDVTVIEGSPKLAKFVDKRLGDRPRVICSFFEDVDIDEQFYAIFFLHTLEHLNDPIAVLKRVRQWLSSSGLLFLVCPNANAPSRQIAVRMGLISHNSAVTQAEQEHGHRCTYTLDALEKVARDAGLKIVDRGGIVFKPLANFQIDKALELGVIEREFLEGCYDLGQVYPDLCASIYLVCEK